MITTLWLTRSKMPSHERWKFNKPIIILIAAISEACLYELVTRARFNVREGVPNISQRHLEAIRSSKKDGLDYLTKTCKQLKILGHPKSDIYSNLEEVARLRDRIHIQNKHGFQPACEKTAFSEEKLVISEKTLEQILVILSRNYPRRLCYTEPIYLPWNHIQDA